MRDLINLLSVINEGANLSAGELMKYEWRFQRFVEKIKNGEPFLDLEGNEIIADPKEANRFMKLYKNGQLSGSISMMTADGAQIPISKLKKTPELAKPTGKVAAVGQVTKENALVKPSLIKICDFDIPASDFYSVIAKNDVLQSTDYGQVVIQLAQYIVSGESVMLPEEYISKENEHIRKAIVDYAGEYLGVLALLYNRSKFPKREEFQKWLGGSIGDLTLNFPSKANTNIADSFATVKNAKTQHDINISSKGTGGGAPPAISGLKISDDLKRNPEFATAIEFIEICQKKKVKGGIPSTIVQAFEAVDLIYRTNPSSLPKKLHKFLPFSEKNPKLLPECARIIAEKSPEMLPAKFNDLINDVDSDTATDGGKVVYTLKRTVAHAINHSDAIPNFKQTILHVLEMNFIQQYTDYYKNGEIKFYTQWPAKLEGEISVENKSSAVSPTDGGFSFKLGRPSENDGVSADAGDSPYDNPKVAVPKAAKQIAAGSKVKTGGDEIGKVGRRKR